MKSKLYILLILVAIGTLIFSVHHHHAAITLESNTAAPSSVPVSKNAAPSVTPLVHALTSSTSVESNTRLSATVRNIVDSRADSSSRDQAVQSLTGKLSDSDREALFGLLRQHLAEDDQQLGQVFKNDLMNALCTMQPPPDGLRQLLTDIYRDSNQNEVLRDYAVQHLAAFYRQMSMATSMDPTVRNDELQQTQNVLWQALDETSTSIAGTALLGISQLSQQGWQGFDSQKIQDAALRMAQDNSAGELTQITAFQVCANLGVTNALPAILNSVQQPQTESVQISAIAALGQLGNQDQEQLLSSFAQGPDPRLKLPAQHALERIQQRLQIGT